MKLIPLTQGKIAIVDDADFEQVSRFRWCASRDYSGGFVVMRVDLSSGRRKTILMHRQLLGLTDPKIDTDHINHNTLDNRRANLRICTHQQNIFNMKLRSHSSKFKGVSWHKQCRKWEGYIEVNDKKIHLGLFEDEREAAKAYNAAAKKYFKEFACLNDLEESETLAVNA
jgi:hypothetical protein